MKAPEIKYEEVIALQEKYQREPATYLKEALGVNAKSLWESPVNILNALAKHRKVAVKAGHGVSKSWTCGRVPLWWLSSYYPSKVVTTAPTFIQVERIIWSELASAYKNALRPIGGKLFKTELNLAPDWWGIGISTDEEQRFQGFHSPNLLVIFDEAGGVKPEIWKATEGLVTGGNNKHLVIGNPLSPNGEFFNCFKPNSGYHCITISCLDTPTYKAGKLFHEGKITRKQYEQYIIEGVSTYEWVEDKRKQWGEDSPLWYSKVLGEFPIEGDDTLIPLTFVERAREKEIALNPLGIYLGVDVARFGSDSTVITVFDGYRMKYRRVYKKQGVTETAGWVIDTLRNEGASQAPIAIDDTGLGGGVTDILNEQKYNVMPVIGKARAEDEDKYYDIRSEMLFELADRFKKGIIAINDPLENRNLYDTLANQLVSLRYEMDRRGRLKVVSKDKMKKEGLESPDEADSLALAVYASKGFRRKRGNIKPTRNMYSGGGAGGY